MTFFMTMMTSWIMTTWSHDSCDSYKTTAESKTKTPRSLHENEGTDVVTHSDMIISEVINSLMLLHWILNVISGYEKYINLLTRQSRWIELQSNPDKVLASVLCQSEDFIRMRTLSGLTFLWPCVCEIGLCNADPKHHV